MDASGHPRGFFQSVLGGLHSLKHYPTLLTTQMSALKPEMPSPTYRCAQLRFPAHIQQSCGGLPAVVTTLLIAHTSSTQQCVHAVVPGLTSILLHLHVNIATCIGKGRLIAPLLLLLMLCLTAVLLLAQASAPASLHLPGHETRCGVVSTSTSKSTWHQIIPLRLCLTHGITGWALHRWRNHKAVPDHGHLQHHAYHP